MLVNNVFLALPKLFVPFIFASNSYFLKNHIYKNGFFSYNEENILSINHKHKNNIMNYISTNDNIYTKIENNKYLIDMECKQFKNNLNNDLHTLDMFRNDIYSKNDFNKIKLNTYDKDDKIKNNVDNYLIYLNYFNNVIEDTTIKDIHAKSLLEEYCEMIEYYDEILSSIFNNKILCINYNLNLIINDIDVK